MLKARQRQSELLTALAGKHIYTPLLSGSIYWTDDRQLNYNKSQHVINLDPEQTIPPIYKGKLPTGFYLQIDDWRTVSDCQFWQKKGVNTIQLHGSMPLVIPEELELKNKWIKERETGIAYIGEKYRHLGIQKILEKIGAESLTQEQLSYYRTVVTKAERRNQLARLAMKEPGIYTLHEKVAWKLIKSGVNLKMVIFELPHPDKEIGNYLMVRILDPEALNLQIQDVGAAGANPPGVILPEKDWSGWSLDPQYSY